MNQITIYKDLYIDDSSDDYTFKGHVILKPTDTIKIDSVKAYIYLVIRGLMVGRKDKIKTIQIHGSKILLQNESWKIPFSFEMGNRHPDTYHGINANLSYSCEVLIDIDKDDLSKIDRSIYSKIKTFFTTDSSEQVSRHFNVSKSNFTYQVIETNADLQIQTNWMMTIIAGLIFFGGFLLLFPEINQGVVILGLMASALCSFLTKVLIELVFGQVSVKINDLDESIHCYLTKTRKLNLRDQKLYFKIIEEVEDNRGTTTTTRRSTLYFSSEKKISEFNDKAEVQFAYPTRSGLQTYKGSKVNVIWKMNLEGKYFGIPFIFNTNFRVVRN